MKHSIILLFLIPILLVVMYISGCTSSRAGIEKQQNINPARQNPNITVPDYVKVEDDCSLIKGKQRNVIYYIDSVRYAKAAPEPMKAKINRVQLYKCKDLLNKISDYDDRIILVTTEKVSEDEERTPTVRFINY